MLKILKEGNIPKYKVECSECGSIIEFTVNDEKLDVNEGVTYNGISFRAPLIPVWVIYSIKCPLCHSKVNTHGQIEGKYFNNTILEDLK